MNTQCSRTSSGSACPRARRRTPPYGIRPGARSRTDAKEPAETVGRRHVPWRRGELAPGCHRAWTSRDGVQVAGDRDAQPSARLPVPRVVVGPPAHHPHQGDVSSTRPFRVPRRCAGAGRRHRPGRDGVPSRSRAGWGGMIPPQFRPRRATVVHPPLIPVFPKICAGSGPRPRTSCRPTRAGAAEVLCGEVTPRSPCATQDLRAQRGAD